MATEVAPPRTDSVDTQRMRATMSRVLAAWTNSAQPIEQFHTGIPNGTLPDAERLELQRKAIVGVLKQTGLGSTSNEHTVIEFGAGDGKLSRAIFQNGIGKHFVLVDKSQQRLDRTQRASNGTDEFEPTQLCADVGTLRPDELRAVAQKGPATDGCIALSNHMCGAALDQAVVCSLAAWDPRGQADAASGAATPAQALCGMVAVTCCHHVCTRDTFLGMRFLREVGLEADFELIRQWSRMAPRRERAATSRPKVVETAQRLGITPDEAAELGSRCRQLMDTGRARFLEQQGFKVSLVHHVPFTLTADHVALVAVNVSGMDGASEQESCTSSLAEQMAQMCEPGSEQEQGPVQ